MHVKLAQFIANYCNTRMDRTLTPMVDADMILKATEEYKCMARMVNGYVPNLIELSIKKARA